MRQKTVWAAVMACVLARGIWAEEPLSALGWLAAHQEPDGHWDSKKYSASKEVDTAVTGLSLLAFLGAGHSEKVGEYKDNVKRAVAWLKSKQDANGRVFQATDSSAMPDQAYAIAMATLSLSEAAAMGNVKETRAAAQRAVDYCADGYPFKRVEGGNDVVLDKTADTAILGWYVIAVESARVAGLKVPDEVIDGFLRYLNSVEHAVAKGGAGEYWYRPDVKANDTYPVHQLSAVGCVSRQMLGFKREDVRASAELFAKQGGLPVWTDKDSNVNLYYWYFGTLALFQQGGPLWKEWSDAMKKALLTAQQKDGDDAKTWLMKDAQTSELGRVGQSALACLCLEVYYRFKQLQPEDAGK